MKRLSDGVLWSVFLGMIAFSGMIIQAADRPNILYIYADDLGWGAIGPNGQQARRAAGLPHVMTPNLDRLAASGVNFTRSYGCTVCSPARSSQQTGFHQGHTFADRNDPDNAKKAIRAEDRSMGELLAEAGYATGYWGKWGYGASKNLDQPELLNIQTLPTSHGYQDVLAELHHVRAHTFFQPTLWRAPAPEDALGGLVLQPNSLSPYKGKRDYPDYPAMQNHVDYPEPAYCDDAYAFAAFDFVRENAKIYRETGRPFFGLFAAQIPHAPFQEIAELPGWSDPYLKQAGFDSLGDQARAWAAMVTRLDAHIGNLLDALQDPNGDGDSADSIVENTLVIFQSDNGGPNHEARQVFAANGGLRGQKGQIFEGGIRVPTIMRWPKRIHSRSLLQAGSSRDQVIDVSDLLPTFCELAGVEPPFGLDGVSLAPTLRGIGVQRKREFLIHEAGPSQSIIRGRYKLIRNRGKLALYDLVADRSEATNIAASHPDLVKRLEALLIGERVTEPRGFATTYHRWIGPHEGSASDPENWSDYLYENKGIRYQFDDGAPQRSWLASVRNETTENRILQVLEDLTLLGIEIQGSTSTDAHQWVQVGDKVTLSGRNEIRLGVNGHILLAGGRLASLRWVDIGKGAMIKGWGQISGHVHNNGTVLVSEDSEGNTGFLDVSSDYLEVPEATLRLGGNNKGLGRLRVGGQARLAGLLELDLKAGFVPVQGQVFTVLSADRVVGQFSNESSIVRAGPGLRFRISYLGTSVRLSVL